MEDRARFLGTWRLLANEARTRSLEVTLPLGPHPQGYLVYTGDGHVSVIMAQRDRPPFQGRDMAGTPEEMVSAYTTCQAYAGTFEVQGERVVHRVEVASFPNWVGASQERFYAFEGDRLILRTPPVVLWGEERTFVLTWERVR